MTDHQIPAEPINTADLDDDSFATLVGDLLVTLQEELSNWDTTSGSVDPATLRKVFMAAVDQLTDQDFGAAENGGAR
jgi:hypothetical protein